MTRVVLTAFCAVYAISVAAGQGGSSSIGGNGGGMVITVVGCVYKGKTYKQGQTWFDGCIFVCICNDVVVGAFVCTRRCTTYTGLPYSCSLQPDPNDSCCKKPVCFGGGSGTGNRTGRGNLIIPGGSSTGNGGTYPVPGGTYTGTGTGGTYPVPGGQTGSGNGVVTGQTSGCLYNGKTYKQGETWKDGCKYSCACTNGATGRFTCSAMCPQWQLPEVCSLQPRPGKCCPKPSCPPNYSINYPPGMSESTLP